MRTRRVRRGTPRAALAAAFVVVATLLGVGCGGGELADADRDPATITVGATLARAGVTVSPSRIGAGTIDLLVSNQTATSQRVALRSARLAAGGRRLAQHTGPVNPGGTASLTADVAPGTYVVSARGSRIAPATIAVGPARRAQDVGSAP